MKYDEFVGHVQARASLGSLGDAVSAIRATLENLALRLDCDSADKFASQLPREIGYYLVNAPRFEDRAERFDIDEFFERVSESEQADFPDAVYHARVVMEVVREAVSPGQLRKIMDQLPEDFDRLLEAGSAGRLRLPRRSRQTRPQGDRGRGRYTY